MVLYSNPLSYSDILEDRGLAINKLFKKLFCPFVCVCVCKRHTTISVTSPHFPLVSQTISSLTVYDEYMTALVHGLLKKWPDTDPITS